jgi:hypothetical protein
MYGVNAELFDTADEMFGAQNFSSRYGWDMAAILPNRKTTKGLPKT